MVVLEYFFQWLVTLDPIMAGGILVFSVIFLLICVSILVRSLTSAIDQSKNKKTPLSVFLSFFKKEKDTEVVEAEEEVVETRRSTDSSEILVLIMKLLQFKDAQADIDKDWISDSMKTVESMMQLEFPKSFKKVLFDSNADFYTKNQEVLKLITEAIIEYLKDEFKRAIKDNHLHKYQNPILKKEYLSINSQRLSNEATAKICTVINSVKDSKGCIDSDIPPEVTTSITNLFDAIFSKLIDFAVFRELKKVEIVNTLIQQLENDDDLSPSTINLLKGIMKIETIEVSK